MLAGRAARRFAPKRWQRVNAVPVPCVRSAHVGQHPDDRDGRRLFDNTNGWEGQPPAGEHVVVVSYRPKPQGWRPEASYRFVGDVAAAITLARELAGDGVASLNSGEVGGQALALGRVDEVTMDVVPVVFGSGKRFPGSIADQRSLEDPRATVPIISSWILAYLRRLTNHDRRQACPGSPVNGR